MIWNLSTRASAFVKTDNFITRVYIARTSQDPGKRWDEIVGIELGDWCAIFKNLNCLVENLKYVNEEILKREKIEARKIGDAFFGAAERLIDFAERSVSFVDLDCESLKKITNDLSAVYDRRGLSRCYIEEEDSENESRRSSMSECSVDYECTEFPDPVDYCHLNREDVIDVKNLTSVVVAVRMNKESHEGVVCFKNIARPEERDEDLSGDQEFHASLDEIKTLMDASYDINTYIHNVMSSILLEKLR